LSETAALAGYLFCKREKKMSNKLIPIAFLLFGLSTSSFSQSCKISGTWKHADKPAWLNISIQEAEIIVKRHENYPQVEGSTLIKTLQTDPANPESWIGAMYSGEQDSHVPVQIKHSECNTLRVFHHGKEVLRLFRE
jgi:hypothetical protein